MSLHDSIQREVDVWRTNRHPCEEFPAIAEILDWSRLNKSDTLRFLRRPQLRALETYWYLRLVKGTPHVFDLYRGFHPRPRELREALGLMSDSIRYWVEDHSLEELWDRVKTDDDFVRANKLEALRETLTLDYPSYILALAMGAGKTILIGAIIATEFAMALEYPNGQFVQNALVFAPGTTIIESLRELIEIPYERILPPRLHKQFAASAKLTFTRDGEKDIPVIRDSSFNVVVTNTEKIRIQKQPLRKSQIGGLFAGKEEEERTELANLRLQTIASLPHLAVFSDEAHHTYGQKLDAGLKRVRQTVDYLAANTNVIAVVNTTGTPYFQKQPLKDVVFWYGLGQGIRDSYLKELSGGIKSYRFDDNAAIFVDHVVKDFFQDYANVRLPNGSSAKLAIYFPQTEDLKELRPVIDKALADCGQSPALCLVNTSDSELTKSADEDAFKALKNPGSPHRVILLVNRGTEGWNCPSLFACALARRLPNSNNFVLQAATRCLRQVPGNTYRARVYLSADNFSVLDRQLQETYGESISQINYQSDIETRRTRIVLKKLDIPPLVVRQTVRTVVRGEMLSPQPLSLKRPTAAMTRKLREQTFVLSEQQSTVSVLKQLGDTVEIAAPLELADGYFAAVELAARYRLDVWTVRDELGRLYGDDDVPLPDLEDLARQIEEQTRSYVIQEKEIDVALALVKLDSDAFDIETNEDGTVCYTAEIVYPKGDEHLLMSWDQMQAQNPADFGFHYSPYNFDSNPEKSFFETLIELLQLRREEIEDIYFTGALTDPGKTDFFVEYKDDDGHWRRYTPDFVIRKKPGKGHKRGTGRVLIVEVKDEKRRNDPLDGEVGRKAAAVKRWESLDPDRLRYEMVFANEAMVTNDETKKVRQWIEEPAK